MKKNKLIALFAGLSLAFVGSAALAAPSPDTLLVAGYDSDEMAVLYGVSGIDQKTDTEATLDCTLIGDFTYTVGEANEDGVADVVTLTSDGTDPESDTLFEAEETVKSDPTPPTSIPYDTLYASTEDEGKDCLLTSVTIEPNGDGEVNHGTFVSTFAHLLQGGKGCIMRHISKTTWGKPDADTATPLVTESTADPDVTLDSIMTSCKNQRDRILGVDDESTSSDTVTDRGPKKDKANKGNGKGKANAPGHNK